MAALYAVNGECPFALWGRTACAIITQDASRQLGPHPSHSRAGLLCQRWL